MTEQTVFAGVFTDEELAVLARPNPFAVSPYLDTLSPPDRQTAARTAYRSLLARGLVDPPSAEALAAARAAGDGRLELMVDREIRSVLTLRESARVVIAVARTTSAGQDYWYGYHVDDVVLLEQIGTDGLHRFALARPAQLTELAVAAAVHPDSGDAAGPPVAMPPGPDPTPPTPILTALGQALLRADVVVRHPGEDAVSPLVAFSGPGGWWLVTGLGGPAAMAHPVRAAQLREQLARHIERMRDEAVGVVRT